MKVKNPESKYHLDIRKGYKVLDVGSGHNPYKRANVLLERYPKNDEHRCGPIKIPKGKRFVTYEDDRFPFKANEFDYVTCIHVLEHVDRPDIFIGELTRIAPKGYIETPSLVGELLIPKESHRWVILENEGKLLLMDKKSIPFKSFWGNMFQKDVTSNSIEFRLFQESFKNIFTVRYEWEGNIEYLINPVEEFYRKWFFENWTQDMINELIQKRSKIKQIATFIRGIIMLSKTFALK